MKLWKKVTLGLMLGIIFGLYFPGYVDYVKPFGDVFLRLIQMVIIPVIFFSLSSGVTSISDPSSLGRVGIKATIAFLATTFFATIFGILVALILQPGKNISINLGNITPKEPIMDFNFSHLLINIIPNNIIDAFGKGNIIQVVFFAICFGLTVNSIGTVGNPVKNFLHIMSKIVLKMISVVIQLSPYGAFALTAWVIGTQGFEVMISLSKLVFSILIAMILQYGIFGLLIFVFGKISPLPFYRKSLEYQILAFSTSSSKATLATTMQVCHEKLGISEPSSTFILPLGASINMDGFAINLSLTTIFFAQMLGVDLTYYDYLVIIFTSTLGSIGGAGIPGASLIMLPMVLSSVNLPIEGVAIIAGVDRIMDMLRTTINITGDATITLIIDSSENKLDRERYFS